MVVVGMAERPENGVDVTAGLTEQQKQAFEDDGYLLLEGFATDAEILRLRERMDELVEAFDPATSRSIFSTKDQKRLTDAYFFASANNISFFFEEKAFDKEEEEEEEEEEEVVGGDSQSAGKIPKLRRSKQVSINKVGHALHDLDPVFRPFSRSAKAMAVLGSLGYRRPIPVQSMYIFKQPGIGGEVTPHQDSTFLYTDPPSCIGIWIALEDATKENGCLWVLPGSHSVQPTRRMVSDGKGGIRFDGGDLPTYDLSQFRPVEVKAGTAVILHGAVVHNSYENTSPKSRHAYSVHFVESDGCRWMSDNWLQRNEDFPFEPLYNSKSS